MNVMDGLSTFVLLALLTLGNTTPLTTVSQTARTDKDVLGEVENDGFILLNTLITQAPQKQTTTQQGTTTEGEVEGSAMNPEEPSTNAGTTQASTTQTTSMAYIPIQNTGVMATTESEDRTTTETSEDNESKVTTIADLLSTMSDSGSGDEQNTLSPSFTEANTEGSGETEGSFISSTSMSYTIVEHVPQAKGLNIKAVRAEGNSIPQVDIETQKHNGHVTPDWIIILGFLVGLAMLVLICVAIATREKWNGPNQFNKTGVTLTPVNQQREIELEEFLHKKHPKENGKMEEYTVIPLEELPDEYSS